MMDGMLVAAATSLWLGILTSISPCPLATNIAAVSYIGRNMGSTRGVAFSGLLYTAGRMLTYGVLGVILVNSLLSVTEISFFLQKSMNQLLGPILVIAGMFLLGLLRLTGSGKGISKNLQNRADSMGIWGAGLLGIVFALSFCPVSAALFFGSLIPLSLNQESSFLIPLVYGIGTGLPVVVFAFIMAFAAQFLGKAFDKMTIFERWMRRITGAGFIVVGLYFCLKYVFEVI